MLRVSDETREQVLRIGREEFGGASADETVRRLVDEHWQAAAVAAVRRSRDRDPGGWSAYVADAEASSSADAAIGDEWSANSG
jgi:hypothetical protein